MQPRPVPAIAKRSSLDDIGDRDAPAGSEPWCRYFAFQAKVTRGEMDTKVKQLRRVIGYLEEYEAWRVLGYPSESFMLHIECNMSMDEVDRLKAADGEQTIGAVIGLNPNGVKYNDITSDNVRGTPTVGAVGGNAVDYWTARLARDRPDILERMKAGEFRSVRAARRAAGLLRPTVMIYLDSPEAAAHVIKSHFRGDRLAALIAALQEGLS